MHAFDDYTEFAQFHHKLFIITDDEHDDNKFTIQWSSEHMK